jgi:hypothetical protein
MEDRMLIGTIVRLQVQRSSLKIGEDRRRRYDPAPIQPVQALDLMPGGVVGWTETGERVLDVHHMDHPLSKNRNGDNGISIGFTSHYELMRSRLGDHLFDGLAGENILVATDRRFDASDLPERLEIETTDGTTIELGGVMVAEPCVEFTRFAMRFPDDARPDATVTEALDFLRRGVRGYYATHLGAPARVQRNDRLRLLQWTNP